MRRIIKVVGVEQARTFGPKLRASRSARSRYAGNIITRVQQPVAATPRAMSKLRLQPASGHWQLHAQRLNRPKPSLADRSWGGRYRLLNGHSPIRFREWSAGRVLLTRFRQSAKAFRRVFSWVDGTCGCSTMETAQFAFNFGQDVGRSGGLAVLTANSDRGTPSP